MPEADETIITRFLVEAEEAIEETEKFRKQIDTIKTQIRETSKVTKESFETVAKSIKRVKIEEFTTEIARLEKKIKDIRAIPGIVSDANAAKLKAYKAIIQGVNREMREFKEASTTALSEVKRESDQAATGLQGFITKVTNLGGIGKYVFGAIIGISAIQALRSLVRGIKDAAEAALDFQQKLFAFQISVRALQRAGLETTLQEWYELLQDIKDEFPIFSRRDITEAAALAGLMTREFGFTTEQIQNVIRSSAALSLIWGKDLTESVRGLTYAISSGYFESLQRVGIQISRNIVAQEALRQGYGESYNALDEAVRAAITYDIVMGQIGSLTEDTSKLLETQAGQVLASSIN
jgi:ABC-type arginine transport system permease subunit